jgi:hypothetical protein
LDLQGFPTPLGTFVELWSTSVPAPGPLAQPDEMMLTR